jgi:hypothetical protein
LVGRRCRAAADIGLFVYGCIKLIAKRYAMFGWRITKEHPYCRAAKRRRSTSALPKTSSSHQVAPVAPSPTKNVRDVMRSRPEREVIGF